MTKKIAIAIGSTTSLPGDLEHNLKQISDFAIRAGKEGIDVLLTPELSASGYGGYPEVMATAERAGNGPIFEQLSNLTTKTGVVIAAGFVEQTKNKCHLSHYVVYPDGQYVVQRKHRVTDIERPMEPCVPLDKNQQPTDLQYNFFEVQGVRCAVNICADAGITNINEYFASEGVELVFGPTGAGGKRDERLTTSELNSESGRQKYLKILETVFSPKTGVTDCLKYKRALAAVNMCGYDGKNLYHAGHGMIINPMGEVVGFFHGIPNIDRQRPMYASAIIDVAESLNE